VEDERDEADRAEADEDEDVVAGGFGYVGVAESGKSGKLGESVGKEELRVATSGAAEENDESGEDESAVSAAEAEPVVSMLFSHLLSMGATLGE